jgi:hypothetical protein
MPSTAEVLCGEVSGGGARIGVRLGLSDVTAELSLDAVDGPRAAPFVGFRGCLQRQARDRGPGHPGLAS